MPTYERRRDRAGRAYWRVRVAGRWYSEDGSGGRLWTKVAAESYARIREQGTRSGADRTVAEAAARYLLEELPRLAPSSRRNRRAHLAWWVDRLGGLGLGAVTRADALDCLRKLDRSHATRNRYRAALSALLSCAVDWAWLDGNPIHNRARRKRPKGEREVERERVLSPAERDRLLAACRADHERTLYPLVLAAYYSGARQGELMGLRWPDVIDHGAGSLRAEVRETKSGVPRVLVFLGPASEALREFGGETVRGFDRFVFPAGRLAQPLFPREAWERARTAAKLGDFRFHDLRHCWAVGLLDAGATLPQLMILGGWRGPQMVARYARMAQRGAPPDAAFYELTRGEGARLAL